MSRNYGGLVATVGGDPEVFLLKRNKRSPFPAHWVGLPYKQMPANLIDGKVLRDGYALELNPKFSDCRHMLLGYFWNLLRQVRNRYLGDEQLVTKSAMKIDLATLKDAPDDVSEFGCEGAWNAYDETIHKPEIHGPSHPWRYTGGHIHVAFPLGSTVKWASKLENVFRWAKITDRYVGTISTYLTGSELAGLRRKYYGLAGEFRLQEHPKTVAALEYRTPGSEIWSHPALTSLMLGLTRYIYEHFEEFSAAYSPTYESQVQAAINRGVSDNDLLDLIPELPGWYTRKLLKKARPFFRSRMHKNLVPYLDQHTNQSFGGYGWGEWCKGEGYLHYRPNADYDHTSEDAVYAEHAIKNNARWGEKSEVA